MKIYPTDFLNSQQSKAPVGDKTQEGIREFWQRREPKSTGNLALVNLPAEETSEFRRMVREWLLACKANGRSPKTLEDYQDKLFKFYWWWREHTRYAEKLGDGPENVTVRQAREFVAYLREPQVFRWGITSTANNKHRHELSPASVASYGRTVKAFFNWLATEDLIDDSPFKKSVKFSVSSRDRSQVIKRLEEPALIKLFEYLMKPERLVQFCGKRDLAIFALLLDSGIRRGELISMEEQDVDLERSRALVRGKTGQRYAMFQEEAKVALRSYLAARSKFNPNGHKALWLTADCEPLSYQGFNGIFRRIERGTGEHYHAHEFRHTFASMMAEQQMDPFTLKELLGHTSITTTQIYVNVNPEKLAEAHRSRSPLGKLPINQQMRRRRGRPSKEQ